MDREPDVDTPCRKVHLLLGLAANAEWTSDVEWLMFKLRSLIVATECRADPLAPEWSFGNLSQREH